VPCTSELLISVTNVSIPLSGILAESCSHFLLATCNIIGDWISYLKAVGTNRDLLEIGMGNELSGNL
jgi:hypothetical protein